jgi:hypothetical protein
MMGASDMVLGMVTENYIKNRVETEQQKDQLATILLDDSRPARANFDAKKEADAIEKTLPSKMPNYDSKEQTRRDLAKSLSQYTPGEFDQIVKQMQSDHPIKPDMKYPHLAVDSSVNGRHIRLNLNPDSNKWSSWEPLDLPVQRWNSVDTGKALQNAFCSGQPDSNPIAATEFLKSLSSKQISTMVAAGALYCKK